MRRIPFKMMLFLLAGAIINIAVAWGCAYAFGPADARSELISFGGDFGTGATLWRHIGSERWFVYVNDRPTLSSQQMPQRLDGNWMHHELTRQRERNLQVFEGLELRRLATHTNQEWPSQAMTRRVASIFSEHVVLVADSRGWPARAMGCEFAPVTNSPSSLDAVSGGVAVKPFSSPSPVRVIHPWLEIRILPLKPLWPGFAINTFFYSAILWVLFAAPLAIRRKRRIRLGLCRACGYPIGTSAACTECGAAVRGG